MKKLILCFLLAVVCLPGTVQAAESSADEPTLEQRIADLEGYINNSGRETGVHSKVPGPGPGHNAWMMTSAALVLFMTLPGLALFYGGLVRSKNVLSVLAQCIGLAGLVTILWWVCGYSLSFSEGGSILGGLGHAFFRGVGPEPADPSSWLSHNIFCIYQMMFAIITPALTIGAIAERMKFSAIMLFSALWMFAVYFPIAHMVWGPGGMMNGLGNADAPIKAIDFAGGIVVHMTSGWSALVLCMLLGKRQGFGREPMPPHSMVLCMVGTGMLWVGWYGFNAGSALASDTIAANAFVTTTMAAAVGSFAWAGIEYFTKGKPSVLGFCSGAIGGLATITPAAGFVTPGSAVLIGLLAGVATFLACTKIKVWLGYDDALDTFGVHAVGGTLGILLAGILGSTQANAALESLAETNLFLEQIKAAVVTLVWSAAATVVLAFLVKAVLGGSLRPIPETETIGLDLAEHGEEGYHD